MFPLNSSRNLFKVIAIIICTLGLLSFTHADNNSKTRYLKIKKLLKKDYAKTKKHPNNVADVQNILLKKNIYSLNYSNIKNTQQFERILQNKNILELISNNLITVESPPAGAIIKFIYNKGKLNSFIRNLSNKKLLTKFYGIYNSSNVGPKKIVTFIRNILNIPLNYQNFDLINQDFKKLYGKRIEDFRTINEIFSRKLLKEEIDILHKKYNIKSDIITSNSYSRIRVVENVNNKKSYYLIDKTIGGVKNRFNLWRLFGQKTVDLDILKDKQITQINNLQNMLSPNAATSCNTILKATHQIILIDNLINLQNSTMLINRLAPADYHHIHFPFEKGRVLSLYSLLDRIFKERGLRIPQNSKCQELNATKIHLDGKYFSVNTIATSSKAIKFNPLTENVRDITFFEIPKVGICPIVFIGASGVGKSVLNLPHDKMIQRGHDLGHFEFGGSSTITFFPQNSVEMVNKLSYLNNIKYALPHNSQKRRLYLENYVELGVPLFKIK